SERNTHFGHGCPPRLPAPSLLPRGGANTSPLRHDRQYHARGSEAAVKDPLDRRPPHSFAGKITPSVEVAVKPGEIAARHRQTDAVAGGKPVARRPQLDAVLIQFSRLQ